MKFYYRFFFGLSSEVLPHKKDRLWWYFLWQISSKSPKQALIVPSVCYNGDK